MMERWLSSKDIAERLGVSTKKAWEIMHSIPHVRIGKFMRCRPEVLEAWIKKQERVG